MEKLIIDTNVIIRHLKGGEGILSDLLGGYKLYISAVTILELMGAKRAGNKSVQEELSKFLKENFEVVAVSEAIALRAGEIVRDVDIAAVHSIIAATAIEQDLPLLTYEVATFDNIPDLKIVEI